MWTMKPKRQFRNILAGAVVAASLVPAAQAEHRSPLVADSFTDYARVLSAEPVYETVVNSRPSEQCWNERVRPARYDRGHRGGHRGDHSTPMLVGAILGGALGNELGHHKRNKQVGAVLGGLLGGSVARDIARQNHSAHDHASRHREHRVRYETVRRCETTYESFEEQKLVGYEVSYRYRGRVYTAQTVDHPGERMPLRVSIAPEL